LQAAYIECRLHRDSIRLTGPEQQLERPCKFSALEAAQILVRRFSRLAGSPKSSPSSQKAAALLLDLGAVDIR
jgi:hypothetical protein